MTIEQLTTFLGWCTAINAGLLIFSSLLVMAFRPLMASFYQKYFGIQPAVTIVMAFGFLGFYKVLIVVFNLVPYLALMMMA
ncbi:DUF6868 family protein [Mucisphaera calidilacus]|uniref:DUF6868 domain-containing protein n=1 Tax=Mucisphaera calidilacus TaxID=2527982 RepID=A0A518BZT9_9BACT|nr:hypothetical protein [Mucisphaera calidilacus]QDU72485.1 hypothetical protein Pan265_23510 [Mucisphaera calidilacus]